MSNRIKDTNNTTNSSVINKIVAVKSPKKEVGIWPVLIIVIVSGELTKNI